MATREPGDPMRSTPEGTAEVHSRIITPAGTAAVHTDRTDTSESSKTDQVKAKAQDLGNQARDRAQEVGQKASDAASQAQQKAGEMLHRAEQKLDESGALDKVRQNALPALGLAFGLGFLLAGSGDDEDRDDQYQGDRDRGKRKGGTLYKAKHQLKGAIMGGLSAAIAQEARSLAGIGGKGGEQGSGLLSSILGGSGSRSGGGTSGSQTQHRPPSHQETR